MKSWQYKNTISICVGENGLCSGKFNVILEVVPSIFFRFKDKLQEFATFLTLLLLVVIKCIVFFSYLTASDTQAVQSINEAIQRYADETCIKFTPSSSATYRLKIFKSGGCYSYIGRIPSNYQPQELSLATGCAFVSKCFSYNRFLWFLEMYAKRKFKPKSSTLKEKTRKH